MWNELGFRDNPYSPRPIQANEEGERLLIGRDSELRSLMTYIRSSDSHPTLEGSNGVGKTSLVSVAGFKLYKEFTDHDQPPYIPIEPPFQLTSDDTLQKFKQKVLLSIAQAFIAHNTILKEKGYNVPQIDNINQWLNSPLFHLNGGGMSVAGFGGTVTRSTAPNTSTGFTESGFILSVQNWLRECFPTRSAGAFICIIDNLELLETSKGARDLLEAIRDELLNVHGLRWVLCGARGIIRSSASSPRLQGILSDPLDLQPIDDTNAEQALHKRLEVFSIGDSNAPVESEGFSHIYRIGNRNLRNALKYCEDFSMWAYLEGQIPTEPEEKLTLIKAWMVQLAAKYDADTSGVGKRAWTVFDQIVQSGGSASPSDYEKFGYESQQAMRPQLKLLEEANLIESSIDETDKRRRTIIVTSRGWIVNYKRREHVIN